jgi:hypothetical protein
MIKKANMFLAIGAALAFATVYTSAAHAQDVTDARQHGYQHGYRDGFEQGATARTNGGTADFHTQDYDRADRGYQPYVGSLDAFKDGYRDGYKTGYSDGFAGNRNRFGEVFGWPNANYNPDVDQTPQLGNGYAEHHWVGRDVANDIGYRDGLAAGAHDSASGHSFRPTQHDAWKHADHGYHGEFGDKALYKQYYRESFEAGYKDGFGQH